MPNHAVFFDRDNTLNHDPGYLGDPKLVELFPGVGKGINRLQKENNFKIIVISNQSGISRGILTNQQVEKVNNRINEILTPFDCRIDAFYYCPYHPDFSSAEDSKCRKPSPQLVLEAAEEHDVDLSSSYFVGDKSIDVECGINAGLKTILINYENDNDKINLLKNEGKTPNFIAYNFLDACDFIISDFDGGVN